MRLFSFAKNMLFITLSLGVMVLSTSNAAKAQVYKAGVNTVPVTKIYGSGGMYMTDTNTLVDATSKTDTVKITEAQQQVTFMLYTKKNTGTVAGTWVISGGYNITEKFAQLTSITVTDATKTYSYTVDGNPYPYYELALTTTGTQNSTHCRRIIVRR